MSMEEIHIARITMDLQKGREAAENAPPNKTIDAQEGHQFFFIEPTARAVEVGACLLNELLTVIGLKTGEDLIEEFGELVTHGLWKKKVKRHGRDNGLKVRVRGSASLGLGFGLESLGFGIGIE